MTAAYGIVYQALSKVDGKIYIGATRKSLSERVSAHISSAKSSWPTPFQKALKLHGFGSFDWSVLAECGSENDLRVKEKALIKKHSSCDANTGYNTRLGGYGGRQANRGAGPERITFDVHKSVAHPIRQIAKADGLSMADIIRRLLKRGLEDEVTETNA